MCPNIEQFNLERLISRSYILGLHPDRRSHVVYATSDTSELPHTSHSVILCSAREQLGGGEGVDA